MRKIIYNKCRYCGKTAPFSDDAMKELGQEWYDRFEKEYLNLKSEISPFAPAEKIAEALERIGLEAAKKAAGLE